MKEIKNKSLLRDLTSEIEGTSAKWYALFAILVIIFGIGIYALVLQIDKGHEVTGMRDNVVWGLYIVNFIFFMGLSYAGALISGALHLFKAKWRAPVLRFAELITVIALCIGPFFIFFCIGRLDRLYILFTHPRIQSPITWDVIAIITDLVGCFVFLYLSFIEDFAILRDSKDVKMKAWKRKLFVWLALGFQGTEKQYKIIKRSKDIMAAMIIAIAIIVYSVLAWIFGVTLQPGWHSTIFGPYFVIAAVFSGAGLLIVLMQMFRKIYKLEKYITLKHFINVGYILGIIAAFYGYFTFSDYLTKWYGSVKMDKILIDKLFEDYYFLFILANYVGILVPMIIVAFKRFRTIRNIVVAAIIALIGLWINRYIIIVPTLETPFLPIQDSRMEFVKYAPTWVEWSLTAAGIAVFGIFLMLISKIAPLISISEMEEAEEAEKAELKNAL
ncbi:MAG: polysulfide reductase NrfD [Bacteroidales bacterium]|nr:polysulfide reductase NrfD [Bacteroidales bacterium]